MDLARILAISHGTGPRVPIAMRRVTDREAWPRPSPTIYTTVTSRCAARALTGRLHRPSGSGLASSTSGRNAATAERISLRDLVVINMDEYLQADGGTFLGVDDPLSFQGHARSLHEKLDPELAPLFREPPVPGSPTLADRARYRSVGGVDVCFGGVGIMGHLAFDDPPDSPIRLTSPPSRACPRGSFGCRERRC